MCRVPRPLYFMFVVLCLHTGTALPYTELWVCNYQQGNNYRDTDTKLSKELAWKKWSEPLSKTSLRVHHSEGRWSSKCNFRIGFNTTHITVNRTKNLFRASGPATRPTARRPHCGVGRERLTRRHTEKDRKLAAPGYFGHILLVQPTLHSIR
jgi:hypothetical protein